MRRMILVASVLWPVALHAQSAAPIFLGQNLTMLPAAVDASGRTAVFGSAVMPDGANTGIMDLYTAGTDGSGLRRLTKLPSNGTQPRGASTVSLASNGARAAFTMAGSSASPPPPNNAFIEEVHIVDVATGAERVVSVDTQSCIRPAVACVSCFFTCVNNPHLTADGAKVLYSVSRNQPFYIVNSDGTGLTNLPVFSASLAPATQRVMSRNGQIVFISSAPFGPTLGFAAAAPDVYLMNLDGSNIQNVTRFGNSTSIFTSNATISADGAIIAFELTDTGTSGVITSNTPPPVQQIWLVRADGSDRHALTNASESSSAPSLAGNGSAIAFVRSGQIYIVRSDGTGLKALTNFQLSSARDPVISEDGTTVVFTAGPRNGGIGALYSVRTDGTNLRPIYAPRSLNQNGIVGLNFGSAPVPGSLFSAYGLNFTGDSIAAATSFPLPGTLASVSLLVNGLPVPLLAVTPWQINAQLPPELLQGPVAFQLRFVGGASPPAAAADVKSLAPAMFILPAPGNIAPAQAAAFHADGTPADQSHPATDGEVLEIYGTGLGATSPLVPAGMPAPASPAARTLATVQVLIGNVPAQVMFSGLTPGIAGVYQVNAVVPSGLKPGPVTVFWRFDSMTTSNPGTIYVQ